MSHPPQVEEFWVRHQGLRVHATTTGKGDVPIVLLTGMGGPARHWRQVPSREMQEGTMATAPWNGRSLIEPALAALTRVIAYDRGGIDASQAPSAPRTVDDFCDELQAVLDAANVSRAVLVGHSFGGLIAFTFARQCPERVAGLVLLDASHPNQLARFTAVLPPEEGAWWQENAETRAETFPERPLWSGMLRQGEAVASEGVLGALPLAVVSRSHTEPVERLWQWGMTMATREGVAAMDVAWKAMQADYARSSTRGELVVAPNSFHYVHFDAPLEVVSVIERVWRAARDTTL
ncbi:alpha/beta fold hydrolase [Deinococcus yavapaiensis]|uniref:Pimeloyl-ACP methyl ester carboxylesterase n=1 Tax=Deinococcus yavapaiensis KR-236 TaxID=694435 RepID=A0A318S566_9DEIO|nr:alpha/beta hydrolase [Deinococcus yavapaiensis]PYE53634.1 pimeloyl-ACP methyl ester carboxylesterase [Deinococcus yavapaiensis KR-236]